MRRWFGLLVLLSSLAGCGANDETGSDVATGGSGQPSGAGGTNAGFGGQGMDGGRGGSGGGAARAGASSGGAGLAGATGGAGLGAGGSASGAAGVAGAAGMDGRPTSCRDPLVVEDLSEVTATDALETYPVMGTTAAELRQSLNENRGGDYDAYTAWNISWTFSDCTVPVFRFSVEIAYSLPEWDPQAAADPALVAEWNHYMDALYCHEYGHATLGIECANAMFDAFQGLQGDGDCDALTSSASQLFDAVLADYLAREVTYDAETNHGATMGAVFPP